MIQFHFRRIKELKELKQYLLLIKTIRSSKIYYANGKVYKAIIDEKLWDNVQTILDSKKGKT